MSPRLQTKALVHKSEALSEVINPLFESIPDLQLQTIADSAWYRFDTVNVMIRDQGGGALAATLARGLIEQAAYWDWAIATGVGTDRLDYWAALEFHRLLQTAKDIEDWTWLDWLLPPGSALRVPGGTAIPESPSEAVRRIGFGLDDAVLEPLRFDGLLSAYRILDVLAHGNYVGAAILADRPGMQLPDRLAAIVIHLAAAGATAVAHVLVKNADRLDAVATQFKVVATSASGIHGLPLQSATNTSRPARPARSKQTPPLNIKATAEQMFPAPAVLTELGLGFLDAADDLAGVVASDEAWSSGPDGFIPRQSFKLSVSNLLMIRGGLEGILGKALMPIAARMLLEDGARWMWLLHKAEASTPVDALEALANDGRVRRNQISMSLQSDGVPQHLIDEVLGAAGAIPDPKPQSPSLPTLPEMLKVAYPNSSEVQYAPAMYGLLSQFVHATPISNWHIRRDTFPTVTAPIYAVSLEAAARGFERIASITPRLAGISAESLDRPLNELYAKRREMTPLTSPISLSRIGGPLLRSRNRYARRGCLADLAHAEVARTRRLSEARYRPCPPATPRRTRRTLWPQEFVSQGAGSFCSMSLFVALMGPWQVKSRTRVLGRYKDG